MKLLTGWEFKLLNSNDSNLSELNIDEEKWHKATVPGTIHTDLLENKIIDEPFYSDNEIKLSWIADCDWVYQKEFNFDRSRDEEYQLVFDGIDAITEIHLNDSIIGKTKNMFLQYKFDISEFLNNGKNRLKILFKSPNEYSEVEERKYSKLPVALKTSRVYIRKAQYSFGWDWGPVFTTSGIWKDVYIIEKVKAEIENITFNTISINDDEAEVEIKLSVKNRAEDELKLKVKLGIENQIVEKELLIKDSENRIRLIVPNPKLWYPNGAGEQNLYKLSLDLSNNESEICDKKNKTVGIRTIELIDEKEGQPDFLFRINGKTIFCKGANWIPGDTFLPRVSDEKYCNLLTKAKDANMNMIRVWGGGIYENDTFYENCDKLGLLVWQDFMFACGAYPEHEEIIETIKEELSQNIYRLQHHPSIAIWCGNNENEWGWYQGKNLQANELPGYKIYNSIIPDILKTIDTKANYWQSSPFGNDEDPNSTKSGNTHQWDIWSFWKDYTEVVNDDSLFVSEFGFQGPANIDTFNKYIPEKNRKAQDPIFEFHNKQVEGPERLFKFLSSHLPVETKWEDFVYLTQLNQGFALKTCLEHWRTNNRTNGSIIWQLNDVWPVTSWSLIDSDSTPKMSYHFVKNIFRHVLVKINRNENQFSVVVDNQSGKTFTGKIKIDCFELSSGNSIKHSEVDCSTEPSNSVIIALKEFSEYNDDNNIIMVATLNDQNGNRLDRNYFTNGRWKHKEICESKIDVDVLKNNSNQFELTANSLSLFVDVYHPETTFSDRGFIMLPGESVVLDYQNSSGKSIEKNLLRLFTLNNYLSS